MFWLADNTEGMCILLGQIMAESGWAKYASREENIILLVVYVKGIQLIQRQRPYTLNISSR